MKRRTFAIIAAAGIAGAGLANPGAAAGSAASRALTARNDAYRTVAGQSVSRNVFANDRGGPTALVRHTDPLHGSVTVDANGRVTYVPAAGFVGTDQFTYTATDAAILFKTHIPPLATIGGVAITGGAYGSSLARVPGTAYQYYGLTDRGPNVDSPDGVKVEPLPDFAPSIGRFRLVGGRAVLLRRIVLKAADGTPYSGRVNTQAGTGETIVDLEGNVLAPDPNGYDPEGLVALRDGTFWVSDEYGPFITHFNRNGRQIGRLSPFDGSLPGELALRVPNKGMEGLTVTPDGRTLVGMMQSALQTPDLTEKAKNVTTVRIVTVDLRTGVTHEYVYLLDDPATNSGAVSEITALSATRFLVDERDGNVEPGAYKRLFEIDLSGATDVGPASSVPGATYDAAAGGLLLGGRSIDAFVGDDDTAASLAALVAAGVEPVATTQYLDVGALLTQLDPAGGFFGHDKIEGVAVANGGRKLVLSNDSDFGIDGVADDSTPYELAPKILPDGQQDDGEYLAIDTAKLSAGTAATSTATVTVAVR